MVAFPTSAPLLDWGALRAAPGLLPRAKGLYGLFLARPPDGVPTEGCLWRDGRWLMYIGTAGANPGSGGSLRSRIGAHLSGNERRSTLCQTLAALMPECFGPALRRVEPGGVRYHTSPAGVQEMRGWMDANLALCWVVDPCPAQAEAALVRSCAPPLNIDFSHHPFAAHLSACRALRRKRAQDAPPCG